MNANNTEVPPWTIHEHVGFKPLGTNVLVIVEDTERKTPGGLVLPNKDREAALLARVVAIGSAVKIDVKPGDRIMFEKYGGTAIKTTDRPAVLILDASDIMAVLTPDKKRACVCRGHK